MVDRFGRTFAILPPRYGKRGITRLRALFYEFLVWSIILANFLKEKRNKFSMPNSYAFLYEKRLSALVRLRQVLRLRRLAGSPDQLR